MHETKQKGTHAGVVSGGSALRRYQDIVVGSRSIIATLYFEWCMVAGALPGALGMVMRKVFWPRMFQSCGKDTLFGARVTVRHPNRIRLGERVVVSDGCLLDARNTEADCAMRLGDDTMISNNVLLSCKAGTLDVGAGVGLGAQTMVHAVNGAAVRIGKGAMVGPMCYIAGGGNYRMDRTDIPIHEQGLERGGDVEVGDGVWLGANVKVLPGVTMGTGSVAAAGAVVTRSVAPNVICAGVPAKEIRRRGEEAREPHVG